MLAVCLVPACRMTEGHSIRSYKSQLCFYSPVFLWQIVTVPIKNFTWNSIYRLRHWIHNPCCLAIEKAIRKGQPLCRAGVSDPRCKNSCISLLVQISRQWKCSLGIPALSCLLLGDLYRLRLMLGATGAWYGFKSSWKVIVDGLVGMYKAVLHWEMYSCAACKAKAVNITALGDISLPTDWEWVSLATRSSLLRKTFSGQIHGCVSGYYLDFINSSVSELKMDLTETE